MELLLVGFLIGVIIGISVVRLLKPKLIGYLRLDRSDPDDGPYLFLELHEDLSSLMTKDEVMLKVKIEDYIPRK